MTSSNLNRLRNEIASLEKESDHCIPYDKYYVLEILIPVKACEGDSIRELGKNLVLDSKNQPLFTYVRYNRIYVFFSCLEKGNHHLQGSHQSLCSRYGCEITRRSKSQTSSI